jgi:hypothetical protein
MDKPQSNYMITGAKIYISLVEQTINIYSRQTNRLAVDIILLLHIFLVLQMKQQIKFAHFHDMKTRGIVRTIIISTLDGSGEISLRLGTKRKGGCVGPKVL